MKKHEPGPPMDLENMRRTLSRLWLGLVAQVPVRLGRSRRRRMLGAGGLLGGTAMVLCGSRSTNPSCQEGPRRSPAWNIPSLDRNGAASYCGPLRRYGSVPPYWKRQPRATHLLVPYPPGGPVYALQQFEPYMHQVLAAVESALGFRLLEQIMSPVVAQQKHPRGPRMMLANMRELSARTTKVLLDACFDYRFHSGIEHLSAVCSSVA